MKDNIYTDLSKLASKVFHPSLLTIYFLVLLLFGNTYINSSSTSIKLRLILIIYISITSVALPLLLVGITKHIDKYITSFSLNNYKKHIYLLIFAICYIISMFVATPFLGVYFSQKLFLTIAIIVSIANLVSIYKPLSMHVLAMSIFTSAIWVIHFSGYGHLIYEGIVAVLMTGALASARMELEKSSLSEVGYSCLLGVSFTTILLSL